MRDLQHLRSADHSHPRVATDIGTESSAKNGAIFDDAGKFQGWNADRKYAGVESYVYPSTIYRRTTSTRGRPSSLAAVGSIDDSPPFLTDDDRNWLFFSRTWSRNGAIYTVTEEWMLLGRNGWNQVIYG